MAVDAQEHVSVAVDGGGAQIGPTKVEADAVLGHGRAHHSIRVWRTIVLRPVFEARRFVIDGEFVAGSVEMWGYGCGCGFRVVAPWVRLAQGSWPWFDCAELVWDEEVPTARRYSRSAWARYRSMRPIHLLPGRRRHRL